MSEEYPLSFWARVRPWARPTAGRPPCSGHRRVPVGVQLQAQAAPTDRPLGVLLPLASSARCSFPPLVYLHRPPVLTVPQGQEKDSEEGQVPAHHMFDEMPTKEPTHALICTSTMPVG
ncbi:uncharacterized protein [Triticum aestivum]|uniref:uncharacterized protein n=1 Tax=Triticum aestivum TaxID=4565 RepID=UPI001D01B3C4|nr:uncharacterized protein LOC123184279 [Triticum aestivum]